LEGREQADVKMAIELLRWSQKWDANGPEIYLKYISLTERLQTFKDSWTSLEKERGDIAIFRDSILSWRHSRELITSQAAMLLLNSYMRTDDRNRDLLTYGSPIFKVVQQKWCKALYTVLKQSPTPPEYAVGEDSEGSNVDQSVVVLQ